MQEWETAALKCSDLYPLLGLGQRPCIREGWAGGWAQWEPDVSSWWGLASLLLYDKLPISPAHPAFKSMSFFSEVLLSSTEEGGGGGGDTQVHAHTCMHTYIHTCRHTCSHRQPWLCFFPLAYLVEWPWKTKQVLSTFDFSAFKLILSAQLLKQLSSPAVSNFRLGTFTGCQVLSLHCESLTPFLSKRYSNNLYFF